MDIDNWLLGKNQFWLKGYKRGFREGFFTSIFEDFEGEDYCIPHLIEAF